MELNSAVKATVCPIRDVSPIETLYVKIYDITLLLQCSYRVGPAAHYSVPEILVSLDAIGGLTHTRGTPLRVFVAPKGPVLHWLNDES